MGTLLRGRSPMAAPKRKRWVGKDFGTLVMQCALVMVLVVYVNSKLMSSALDVASKRQGNQADSIHDGRGYHEVLSLIDQADQDAGVGKYGGGKEIKPTPLTQGDRETLIKIEGQGKDLGDGMRRLGNPVAKG
eukprot:CAMPEP_0182873402 /NCGR_PEP_ID=MMETSP0034_2-20130328/12307_1 /TAXON_ID=156128 /ORGANISM="Nephroselmis pyriformis, Strain CCMP717" /LENGTH=132 /DNA_ID=CAMNT_0025006047 /DNA_START=71 /DNA_END=466 /DNA_ORIENTATION=-